MSFMGLSELCPVKCYDDKTDNIWNITKKEIDIQDSIVATAISFSRLVQRYSDET
jgi:hypothetical protein